MKAGYFDIRYLARADGSIDVCNLIIGQEQTQESGAQSNRLNYESSPMFLRPFEIIDERSHGERAKGWGKEAGKTGAIIVPETTARPTKPRKRCWSLLALRCGAVAWEAQERLDHVGMDRIMQREQKGRHEHDDAKQCETGISGPHARTCERAFACGRTNARCHLPTPPRGEQDLPCLCLWVKPVPW